MKQQKKKQKREHKSVGRMVPNNAVPTNCKVEQIVRAFLFDNCMNYSPMTHAPAWVVGPDEVVYIGEYHRGYQEFQVSAQTVTACALAGASATKILQTLTKMVENLYGFEVPCVAVYFDEQENPVIAPAQSTVGAVYAAVHKLYNK